MDGQLLYFVEQMERSGFADWQRRYERRYDQPCETLAVLFLLLVLTVYINFVACINYSGLVAKMSSSMLRRYAL